MTLTAAYELFGVSAKISVAALKKRYWQLSRTHHPDAGGSVEKMQAVNAAYKLLKEHVKAKISQELYRKPQSTYGKEAFFVSHNKQDFDV